MDSYVARIKENAEHLAKEVFPKKALELDDLINSPSLDTSNLNDILDISKDLPNAQDLVNKNASNLNSNNFEKHAETETQAAKKRKQDGSTKLATSEDYHAEITGTKVIIYPNGEIKCNNKIFELLKKIKPFIIHFLDSSAILKLWIQILIPQVEDFKAELSLQIQEETLSEIRAIEAEVATYLDHIYKYYAVRAKLISKVAKYPHVADYKQSVCELDEKMFMTIRLVGLELRNHYTAVHDILIKNLEKIKKPRTDNTISMY